ncbi:CBS domain-containing protein [Shewanella gaetbuli]|uniref:CBS domain-containing protein n=1 Tax=Shewanella gaetbuli TaxID=220752 RepID=A0A9X2CN14_9GAMM|nr:CBS domain-containing protein [Shewanella gaetbuli]MCL1144245.1 CBS domain-containing protein [Shewanella gaetbuli]
MRNLELFSTAPVDHLLWSSKPCQSYLDASALELFTDFDTSRPIVVDTSTTAVGTLKIMEHTHSDMRLVVDKNDQFVGVITEQELLQRKLLVKAKENHVTINELLVTEVMIPRESLLALDYKQLEKAKVRDIVATLQESGLQHVLVVDRDTHHIRGLIAANDVQRKLYVSVEINQQPSFGKLYSASH